MKPTIIEDSPDIASSTDDYAQRFSGEIGSWFLRIQSNATSRALRGIPELKVVDVGGGHGQNIDTFLNLSADTIVTGSHESCSHRLLQYIENNQIRFCKTPLTKLPLSDREMDVAVSYRMLAHLDDWDLLIRELCRVSDKRVVVDYPTLRSVNVLNSLLYPFKKKVEKNTRNYNVFREKEIISVFKECGFEMKLRMGQYFLPMALYRMLKNSKIASVLEKVFSVVGLSYLFGSPVIACFERTHK